MIEKCQRCNVRDEDLRTLWMACFYEMDELGLPFKHAVVQADIPAGGRKYYTLRVCKSCRSDWMGAIQQWFNEKTIEESCGSGIFIRDKGAIKEITREQWDAMNPGEEPVVFKDE